MAKGGRGYSPNDMRSMAKNPNSSHYHAAVNNRSNQMNPNNSAYNSSRVSNDSSGFLSGGSNSSENGQEQPFIYDDKIVIDDGGFYSLKTKRLFDVD